MNYITLDKKTVNRLDALEEQIPAIYDALVDLENFDDQQRELAKQNITFSTCAIFQSHTSSKNIHDVVENLMMAIIHAGFTKELLKRAGVGAAIIIKIEELQLGIKDVGQDIIGEK